MTRELPDWITKALEADPIPATQYLLDNIADDLRRAREQNAAWEGLRQTLEAL